MEKQNLVSILLLVITAVALLSFVMIVAVATFYDAATFVQREQLCRSANLDIGQNFTTNDRFFPWEVKVTSADCVAKPTCTSDMGCFTIEAKAQ